MLLCPLEQILFMDQKETECWMSKEEPNDGIGLTREYKSFRGIKEWTPLRRRRVLFLS